MNIKFLERWPAGRGEGFIGYRRTHKEVAGDCGCRADVPFEILRVRVSNTSALENGWVEAWAYTGDRLTHGPIFTQVNNIYDSPNGVQSLINQMADETIAQTQKAIARLDDTIHKLQAQKYG